jgi:hypothetical protein
MNNLMTVWSLENPTLTLSNRFVFSKPTVKGCSDKGNGHLRDNSHRLVLIRRSLSLVDPAAKELGLVDGLSCLVVLLALLESKEVSALFLVGCCILARFGDVWAGNGIVEHDSTTATDWRKLSLATPKS